MSPKIYIDNESKCHNRNPDGIFKEVETDFFDGKCATFIEGYCYIPADESWTRPDGKVFHGEMAAPWKDYSQLAAAQAQYEADLTEAAAAYQEGVDSVWT